MAKKNDTKKAGETLLSVDDNNNDKEEITTTATTKEMETSSGLAPPPAVIPFDDGMGEITQDDLIIPRLKVGQSQSLGDVAGKLFIDVSGDVADEMELVLLKIHKSRVLFPEKFSRDSEPLCRSQDFIVPEDLGEGIEPMAASCADCPYGKWTKGATPKKNTPPRCSEVWNFLVLDYESFMPVWFSLKSTALKPARKIVSMLKLRGTARMIPAWGFKFKANVEVRSGDSGESYLPVFSELTELDPEDRKNMDLIHNQLADETAGFDQEGESAGQPSPGADKNNDDDF